MEAAQDEESECEAFCKGCDLQNSHSVPPANISIVFCNTAITEKHCLFLQKTQGLCLVGSTTVDANACMFGLIGDGCLHSVYVSENTISQVLYKGWL